jgi:hypothetical protein
MPGGPPPGVRKSKFVKKVFDPNSLAAKKSKEAVRLPKEKEGSGSTEIWRIENIKDLAPVDKREYGQFYAGDSYVILYKYEDEGGREQAFIYFWQGRKSTQDEKAASAMQAKDLDDKMGGYPVQVRVEQGKEPPHFFKIFEGNLVIHAGGIGSGFKNVDQADEYDDDGTRLFHVRGTNDYNTRAVQVDERASSLNSGDTFIFECPEQLYIWFGKGCSGDEREFAKRVAPKIHGLQCKNRAVETVYEGDEPVEFWKALGHDDEDERPSYGTADLGDDGEGAEWRPPRLFQVSNARGYIWAEEIFDFCQDDLIPEDCMILDTNADVFIWLGEEARAEEKKGAMEMATEYVKGIPERKVEDTTFMVIKQGKEPPNFTMHFGGWDFDMWSNGKSYEDMVKEMMAQNPAEGAVALTVDLGEALKKYTPGGTIYPYKKLTASDWEQKCEGVQPDSKEQHLSEEEFAIHFKKPGGGSSYTKEEFNGLPQWKKLGLKKQAKLF